MKINNNRECDAMGDNTYMNAGSFDMSSMYKEGMNNCCYNPREMMGETMPGIVCPPVYECPQETVCHRYICHEVPHIQPCNTRIINHHIYRHTFTPAYSCCEENEVQNVYERRCC